MTTQVWSLQRGTVPPLVFTPPASFNLTSVASHDAAPVPFVIDFRPYVKGGRPPYRMSLNSSLPASLVPLPERLMVTGAQPTEGNFTLVVQISDAYGTVATATAYIYVATGPLTVTAVYPDIHGDFGGASGAYNYTPIISGGTPPYTVVSESGRYPGDTANLSGLLFDSSNGNMSGTAHYTGPPAPGTVWGILVTDSKGFTAEAVGTLGIYPS